jgi:TatD DNase family protein
MIRPDFFDVHSHVQFAAYDKDRDEVLARARQVRVWVVNVGTARSTSEKAVALAKKEEDGVFATVGLHPLHAVGAHYDEKEFGPSSKKTSPAEHFDFEYFEKLAKEECVVAIGECGLDYYRLDETSKDKQRAVFLEHIRLAAKLGKPLMIHCREAFSDLIDILKVYYRDFPGGVVHFMSGSREDAKALLDMGFLFSFGGVVTFTSDYDDVVRYIPISNLLLETDAPYVAPVPHRGSRNEPSYLVYTAKRIAEIRNTSVPVLGEQTVINAISLFGIS